MHRHETVHVSMKKSQPCSTAVCIGCPIGAMAIYTQYIDRGGINVYKLGDRRNRSTPGIVQ